MKYEDPVNWRGYFTFAVSRLPFHVSRFFKYQIMKNIIPFLVLIIIVQHAQSQSRKTENLVIVTLDGMRWQEVFGGIDSALVVNKTFTKDSGDMVQHFG